MKTAMTCCPAIMLIFLLAACCSEMGDRALESESTTTDTDVSAILGLEARVFESQISGDIDGWLSCFADDVVLLPPDLPPLAGKQAIHDWVAPFFGEYDLHEETDEREVEVSGNWGFIRAHWTWTMTPTSGGDQVIDTGKSIWIVRRQEDGTWKIARAIWNSDPRP